jgi:hypothetical protein
MTLPEGSKMKQAAKAAAAEHNKKDGHSAYHCEYRLVGPTEAEKEIARKEKLELFKDFAYLFSRDLE